MELNKLSQQGSAGVGSGVEGRTDSQSKRCTWVKDKKIEIKSSSEKLSTYYYKSPLISKGLS